MAPSLRLPVFHSPYSTVSASRPNITVLIKLAPMPLMARVSSTSQNMLAGAKNRPTPPTMVNTPQNWKTFFLPNRSMIFGMNGVISSVMPVLTRVMMPTRPMLPSTYWA